MSLQDLKILSEGADSDHVQASLTGRSFICPQSTIPQLRDANAMRRSERRVVGSAIFDSGALLGVAILYVARRGGRHLVPFG